jgi:hypothetical protein
MALSKEKFNVSESEKESLGNKITDIGILEKEKSRREILTFDMKKLNFLAPEFFEIFEFWIFVADL